MSLGEKIAVGVGVVGVGLAVAAGVAALFGAANDENEKKTAQSEPFYPSFDTHRGPSKYNRKYGYFLCSECKHHWESAHTYRRGRNGVSSFFSFFLSPPPCFEKGKAAFWIDEHRHGYMLPLKTHGEGEI